ncbi:hypothetical protein FP744_10001924 [Trichoderma asperellum]
MNADTSMAFTCPSTYTISTGISSGHTFTTWPCTATTSSNRNTQTTSPISSSSTTTSITSTTISSLPISDSPSGPTSASTEFSDTPTAYTTTEISATPIPTSSQIITPIRQHTGISTGATAGIAVGCAAAGLFIGLLASLLLFRRRKHREITHDVAIVDPKASPLMHNIDSSNSGTGIQLSQYLLDGAPDQDIVSELQALGELICQHVEDNYTLQPVDTNVQVLLQSLERLRLESKTSWLDTELMVSLSASSNTRYIGLRCIIAAVIFASIDFHSVSHYSMLPRPATEMILSMPAAEYGANNALAFSQALSTWRRLSAFLLLSNRSQRTPLQMNQTTVAAQAQRLTTSLVDFLGVFVRSGRESLQADHLREVITECAKFGYVLFSQPADWKFNFEGTSMVDTNRHSVVVCPGLEKCSDHNGTPYTKPRSVAAPVEVAV